MNDETNESEWTILESQNITIDLNGHIKYGNLANFGTLKITSSNFAKGIIQNNIYNHGVISLNGTSKTYISNCKIIVNPEERNNESCIYINNHELLDITNNSEIEGTYAIGGSGGGTISIDTSHLTGGTDAINFVNNNRFTNIIIKGKSVINSRLNGILLPGGNLTLDGDEINHCIITSSNGPAINILKTSSNLYFKYGETYGKRENINQGTTYPRFGATLKTNTENDSYHTFLE